MKRIIFGMAAALAVFSCTGEERVQEQQANMVQLETALGIGSETGDEEYVFGSLESACLTPEGNIAVLDRAWSCVRIYSREGEYLGTTGSQGDGPGQLSMTVYMGISQNGNLFVSQRGGCSEFDCCTGEWIRKEIFNGPPPIAITGSTDSTFVAIHMEMMETDQGLGIQAGVSRFTDCYETDLEYTGRFFELNPVDMSSFFQLGWYGYSFDVDGNGNVYVSDAAADTYRITVYSREGNELLAIERPWTPVRKTEEEMQEERRFFQARFQSLGMGDMAYTPLENWPAIRSTGVDGQGRIWALRGESAVPVFHVYGSQGEELFTAEFPEAGEGGRFWRFSVEDDIMLAWSDAPESGWQQLHIINLPE